MSNKELSSEGPPVRGADTTRTPFDNSDTLISSQGYPSTNHVVPAPQATKSSTPPETSPCPRNTSSAVSFQRLGMGKDASTSANTHPRVVDASNASNLPRLLPSAGHPGLVNSRRPPPAPVGADKSNKGVDEVEDLLASVTGILTRRLWSGMHLEPETQMPRPFQHGVNLNTWDLYSKALSNDEGRAEKAREIESGDASQPIPGDSGTAAVVDDRVTPQTMQALLRNCFQVASQSKRPAKHTFPASSFMTKQSKLKNRNTVAIAVLDKEKHKAIDDLMAAEQHASEKPIPQSSVLGGKQTIDGKVSEATAAVSSKPYRSAKPSRKSSPMQGVNRVATPPSISNLSAALAAPSSVASSCLPSLKVQFEMESVQDEETFAQTASEALKVSEGDLPNPVGASAWPNSTLNFGITKTMMNKNDTALVEKLVRQYSRDIAKSKPFTRGNDTPLTKTNIAKLPHGKLALRSILKSEVATEGLGGAAVKHSQLPESDQGVSSKHGFKSAHMHTKGPKDSRLGAADEPPLSFLEAILSVSREYERISQGEGAGFASIPQDASIAAQNRRDILRRLTSLEGTLIPEQFWVMSNRLLNLPVIESPSAGSVAKPPPGSLAQVLNPRQGPLKVRHDIKKEVENAKNETKQSAPISSVEDNKQSEIGSSSPRKCEFPIDNDQNSPSYDHYMCRTGESVLVLNSSNFSTHLSNEVFFPAVRPVGRAQVYLLSEVLDKMLSLRPDWLSNLINPNAALRILPPLDIQTRSPENPANGPIAAGEFSETQIHPSLDFELARKSEVLFKNYTDASTGVVHVINVGFTELVRQISCECIERGALLDALRQTLMDIAESHVRVLEQAKKRVFSELQARLELQSSWNTIMAELQSTKQQLADKEVECEKLRKEKEILSNKAERLDDLVSRVEIRRQSLRRPLDEGTHDLLMDELEHDITNTVSKTFQLLYNENKRLAKMWKDEKEDTKGDEASEFSSLGDTRKRAIEERETMEAIYERSYKLLSALHEVSDSVDAVSEPFYGKVMLSSVSPKGSPATSRWMTIARAVGEYERTKAHRYRVFAVFSEWCVRYHKRKAAESGEAAIEGSSTLFHPSSPSNKSEDYPFVDVLNELANVLNVHVDSIDWGNTYVEPVATNRPNNGMSTSVLPFSSETVEGTGSSFSPTLNPAHMDGLTSTRFSRFDNGAPHPVLDNRELKQRANFLKKTQDIKRIASLMNVHAVRLRTIQLITDKDLLEMGVKDCRKEEINQLFEHGFDFKSYLSLSRDEFMAAREKEEGGAWGLLASHGGAKAERRKDGDPAPAKSFSGFTIHDVADMLLDVQACLRELAVRFRAMGLSEIVQRGVQPPMQPPARPDDRCPLCGRRDVVSLERARRQEMMRSVAYTVQKRLDEITGRCQRAEADREVARAETRQIRKELERALERMGMKRDPSAPRHRKFSGSQHSVDRRHLEKTMSPVERQASSTMSEVPLSQLSTQKNSPGTTDPLDYRNRKVSLLETDKASSCSDPGPDAGLSMETLRFLDVGAMSGSSPESYVSRDYRRSTLSHSEPDSELSINKQLPENEPEV